MTEPRTIFASIFPSSRAEPKQAVGPPDNGLEHLLEEVLALDRAITRQETLHEAYRDNKRTAQEIGSSVADSVYEAQQTSASAAQLANQADAKAAQASDELRRLGARRRLLLGALAKRGFPTCRWIVHDDSLYHLAPSQASDQGRGPFRLYRLPKNAREQIIPGERPEITTRRVRYTSFYTRSQRQSLCIMGSFIAMYPLTYVLSAQWALSVTLALLITLMLLMRDGSRSLLARFNPDPGIRPLPPLLEIMPYTGKRWRPSPERERPPATRELLEAVDTGPHPAPQHLYSAKEETQPDKWTNG